MFPKRSAPRCESVAQPKCLLHSLTMLATRIDDFPGDERAYAGYLLETITQTLPSCIIQLERQLQEQRRGSNPQRAQIVLEFGHSPTTSPSNTTERPLPSDCQTKSWVKHTTSFFESLPKTEDQWREKRKHASLSSEEDILSTARSLTTACLKRIPFADHRKMDLQPLLLGFAENVGNAMATAKSYSNISHFLSFIFIATCCVVKEHGHSVDDAQQKLVELSRGKREKTPQVLINDRAAVKWLLRQMQRQFGRKLGHRAFELFFLSKPLPCLENLT